MITRETELLGGALVVAGHILNQLVLAIVLAIAQVGIAGVIPNGFLARLEPSSPAIATSGTASYDAETPRAESSKVNSGGT